MAIPRIFLDTTALKFSADRLPRIRTRPTTIQWGGETHEVEVGGFVTHDPNQNLDKTMLKQIRMLPAIADMGKRGQVDLCIHLETTLELWRLPKTDDPRGPFYGAPLRSIEGPVKYARAVTDSQYEFLRRLQHERFLQLQRATGAYQGEGAPPNKNQLTDAFLLWCAESCEADYFLTCDFKLIRHVEGHRRFRPNVEVIGPLDLFRQLQKTKAIPRLWPIRYCVAMFRAHRRGENDAWKNIARRRDA